MLICNRCGLEKSVEQFSVKSGTKRGRAYACKECHSVYRKEHYLANQQKYIDKAQHWNRQSGYAKYGRYGLTEDQYLFMLNKHNGFCWICLDRPATHVDHDHACCDTKNKSCGNCVRGLLCGLCNSILGYARDRVDTLQNAVIYLSDNTT